MQNKKKIWVQPWGYIESLIIALGLFVCGIALDEFTGVASPKPVFPFNLIGGFAFVILLIAAFNMSSELEFFKWLGGIPAAVSAIAFFTILSVILALTPQNTNDPEAYRVTSGWPYFFSYLFLLTTLGMVTLKRMIPFKKKNLGFIINHLGLWLTLASAGLGAGDLQKLSMILEEEKTIWYAYNENNQAVELPFAIKLNEFSIEEYLPKLAIVENREGTIISYKNKPAMIDFEDQSQIELAGYHFDIKDYIAESGRFDKTYVAVKVIGTAPAMLVSVIGDTTSGWISCGSFRMTPQALKLNKNHSLVMTRQEAKRFASDVTIYEKTGEIEDRIIEVNKPIKVGGWKVYQTSYDERMGKWSEISVVELVRDPWIPVVYIGCVMLILGAIYMIYQGRTKQQEQHVE